MRISDWSSYVCSSDLSNASSIPPPHSSSRRTIRSSIKRSRRLPASEICSRSSRGSCLPRRQDKKGLRGSVWVQTKNGAKNGVNEGEERGGEEQGQVHFLPRSRNRSRPDPACTTPFVPRWKRHSGPCFGGAITAARLQ